MGADARARKASVAVNGLHARLKITIPADMLGRAVARGLPADERAFDGKRRAGAVDRQHARLRLAKEKKLLDFCRGNIMYRAI